MVFMPHEAQGKQRKLALPHHGPYRILDLSSTVATLKSVDRPDQDPIRVNLDCVSKCSSDLPDVSWLGPQARRRRRRKPRQSGKQAGERLPETDQDGTRVTRGRVKKRRRVL